MVHTAALELAAHGVRVNAVAPGATRTRLISGVGGDVGRGPAGRRPAATPDEIAGAVFCLASSSPSVRRPGGRRGRQQSPIVYEQQHAATLQLVA
jgi:NAD(P)-dependent dehydrogenase (short-subunit alcohol dehydrogenase family)